jgi:hypothetical protein
MDALAKPDTEINEDYDFWNAARTLKAPYVKLCNAYNSRVRVTLADYRVICEDENQATTAINKGIILNWKSRTAMAKQTTSEMTMELQFLEHHKKEYLELSADFASISFMPKSREALENMKNLVLLDLRILLGADIPWAHVGKQPEAPPSDLATAALLQAEGDDDDSESSKDDAAVVESVDLQAAAQQAAAPDTAAPDTAAPAPDPNNFLTWTHQNWDKVPFDRISFPSGQNPLKTRTYYAVALIFLNKVSLRVQHLNVWKELTAAWEETFGVPLSDESLGNPPSTGPNSFSADERAWCEQTRRFLIAGGESSAASPPRGDGTLRRAPARRRVAVEEHAGGSPAAPAAARRAVAAAAAPKTPASSESTSR